MDGRISLQKRNKRSQRKALLALAFAGALLDTQQPALSQSIESGDWVIERIEHAQIAPEGRAFYMLNVARMYAAGDRREAERQYSLSGDQQGLNWTPGRGAGWVDYWANEASLEAHRKVIGDEAKRDKTHGHPIDKEDLALADAATEAAVKQLEHATDEFSKLNLYFMAARLFEKVGNTAEMRKYDKLVNDNIEGSVGEEQTKAAVSILNSKAYGFIPVVIPDRPRGYPEVRQVDVQPFTESDFQESEKFKLRTAALADKLSTTSDVRRRVHRDLSLWYTKLGKTDMAEKEKQILFELVGFEDDSILYPTAVGCGQLVWWQKNPQPLAMACGMG